MKILSYNVNGIRAALNKDLLGYLTQSNADIVCFQELKAMDNQVDMAEVEAMGYMHYWYSAQKKGYSGVGIWSKIKPLHVEYGCGHELFDFEGRVIRLDFENHSVISAYFPSGTTGDIRQDIKYEFLDYFFDYIEDLRGSIPNLIICGDYNICHKSIDIHNPVSNKNSSGFLPEEREWMDKWFENGMVDTLRKFNPNPDLYTWWSYRAGARGNNKGWRIDYISVTEEMEAKVTAAGIDAQAVHSDHCPIYLELEN
jgi:exodeoxyribonuclease-3